MLDCSCLIETDCTRVIPITEVSSFLPENPSFKQRFVRFRSGSAKEVAALLALKVAISSATLITAFALGFLALRVKRQLTDRFPDPSAQWQILASKISFSIPHLCRGRDRDRRLPH